MGKHSNANNGSELERLRQEIAALKDRLIASEKDVSRADAELHRAQRKIKLLEKERALMRSQFRELEQQSQAVAQEWDDLSAKATGLESALDGASTAFGEVASFLSKRLQERIGGALKAGVESREQLALVAGQAVLDAQFITSLASRVQDLCKVGKPDRLVASARTMSFADMLQSLANSKATATLRVESDGFCLDVLVDEARIIFLNPRSIQFPGRAAFLTYAGAAVPRHVFEDGLLRRQGPDESVYFDLVDDGVLAADRAVQFSRALGMDVLEECVRDPTRCRLELIESATINPRFAELGLNIPVQRFLLLLFSQIDERKVLVAELGGIDRVCAAADTLTQEDIARLEPRHREVVDLLDGHRTIQEVAGAAKLSLLSVCRTLCELKQANLISVHDLEEIMEMHSDPHF